MAIPTSLFGWALAGNQEARAILERRAVASRWRRIARGEVLYCDEERTEDLNQEDTHRE